MSSGRASQLPAARASTRSRILETSLKLFNDEGIAKMSTNRIATELGISPGNLYYHFASKEEIAEWLVRRFDDRIRVIAATADSVAALDDLWLTLHLLFEAIHEYRFIYRDVDYLIRTSAKSAQRVRQITLSSIQAVRHMCHRLADASVLRASSEDVDNLALQMVFTTTCWFTFTRLLPQGDAQSLDSGRAAYQVLTLLTPYLEPDSRGYLTYLRSKYVAH
jgi:AcrR family transcriptional regulator